MVCGSTKGTRKLWVLMAMFTTLSMLIEYTYVKGHQIACFKYAQFNT